MALRTLQPRLTAADLSIAKPRPKVADERYRTIDWKTLRQQVLQRDS